MNNLLMVEDALVEMGINNMQLESCRAWGNSGHFTCLLSLSVLELSFPVHPNLNL